MFNNVTGICRLKINNLLLDYFKLVYIYIYIYIYIYTYIYIYMLGIEYHMEVCTKNQCEREVAPYVQGSRTPNIYY